MILEFSEKTGITVEDILGKSRKANIVAARQMYWMLLKHVEFSVSEMAGLCDVNHATVIHGIRMAVKKIEIGDKLSCGLWEKVKGIEF